MISYTKEELRKLIEDDEDINDKQILISLKDVKDIMRSIAAKTMNSPTAWAEKPMSIKWNSEVDLYAARILDTMIMTEKVKVVKQILLDA